VTQPKFAPILEQDEVRAGYQLAVPEPWVPHRPGESRPSPNSPHLARHGIPGPDQGYALELANRFLPRLALEDGEHSEDVLAGAVAIATRRASLFGRAPVAGDLELALGLFKYLASEGGTWPPAELVDWRREHFAGAAHDYWRRRELADGVPEATLRLKPENIAERLESEPSAWRELAGAT
jgi:hypothetical protein